MKWAPFTHQGERFEFAHLDDFSFDYVIPAKDQDPARTYQVQVEFSHHCFTRNPIAGETYVTADVYPHAKDPRLFDRQRFELSRQLPAILRSIGERFCYHTNHNTSSWSRLWMRKAGSSHEFFWRPRLLEFFLADHAPVLDGCLRASSR